MAKGASGVLGYIDDQVAALADHVPAALDAFDAKGIHQSRVATRRLKAALDLLAPALDKDDIADLSRAGKKLRRRLGPLRDLDVMIDHLAEMEKATKFKPALAWLSERLQDQRRAARQDDAKAGRKSSKLLRDFGDWHRLRVELTPDAEAFRPLVVETLHSQFDAFAQQADQVAGITPKEGDNPIDIHVLRVEGKNLRYTFEIAVAEGLAVPKTVLSTFKLMQDALGTWHDFVVLTERVLSETLDAHLSHHSPEMVFTKLDLAKLFLGNASKSLLRFQSKWKKSAAALRQAIGEAVPLTQAVSMPVAPAVTQFETDRDPPSSEPPAGPGKALPDEIPDTQV